MIPAEAVEAAARAAHKALGMPDHSWDEMSDWYRYDRWQAARLALEAATPHLMAPILALVDEMEEFPSSPEAHIARQFRAVILKALTNE